MKLVAMLLLAGASLAGPAAAQSQADPVNPPAAATGGPTEAQVLKPSDFDAGKPEVPSFQRGSATRAGGPANDLNTSDGRKEEKVPGGSVRNALTGADLFHGNHCGTGTKGADLAPTDDLDASCQRHDRCYEAAGRRSCACDQALRRDALTVSTSAKFSRELRARAVSVAQAAELMECKEP